MTTVFLVSGTSWTVPSDWNSAANTVEAIGGGEFGESGADNQFVNGGAGGIGAYYCKISNFSATSGNSVPIAIGSNLGTDTKFNTSSLVAPGGGSATTPVGTVQNAGGAGGVDNAANLNGGGGGGAGGPNGVGAAGQNTSSGITGGTGDSGHGGTGGTNANGSNGTEFDASHGSGGGGSGATAGTGSAWNGGNYGAGGGGGDGLDGSAGGNGGPGIIVITYTPSGGAAASGEYSSPIIRIKRPAWR
jgi:hypothetical protein